MRKISVFIIISMLCAVTHLQAKKLTVLVYPFSFKGDANNSWTAPGITNAIIEGLSIFTEFEVVPDQERHRTSTGLGVDITRKTSDEDMHKIASALGSDIIFTGDVEAPGKEVTVQYRLINVRAGQGIASFRDKSSITTMPVMINRITIRLVHELKKIQIKDIQTITLSKEDIDKVAGQWKPGGSAYEYYARGLELEYSDPAGELEYFKKAIGLEPEYREALGRAGLIAGYTLNRYKEALGYLSSADNAYKKNSETGTMGYAMFCRNYGVVFMDSGSFKASKTCFDTAGDIYRKLSLTNTLLYTDLLNAYGVLYSYMGDTDTSLKYYYQSRQIMEQIDKKDTMVYVKVIHNIGAGLRAKGDVKGALENFIEAAANIRTIRMEKSELNGVCLMNTGNTYIDLNDLAKGEEYLRNADRVYSGLGLNNTMRYISLCGTYGRLYEKKSQYDTAREYYSKAVSIYEKLGLGNTHNAAVMVNNIGLSYSRQLNYDTALGYFERVKAIEDTLEKKDFHFNGTLALNMALIYERQNNTDQAGRDYYQSYQFLLKSDYKGPYLDYVKSRAEKYNSKK